MIFEINHTGIRTRVLLRWLSLPLGSALLFAGSAPVRADTLMDAVEAAYANNPTLVQQRFRQQSVNETYVQTRAQYGPTVSVSATAQYEHQKLRTIERNTNQGELSFGVSQPVYSGGRIRGQVAEARANVRASEEDLRRTEGEVVRNVITVYAAVIRDEQRLNVSRENVAALRAQLDERRAKRRVRDVTITDVAQSDSRLAGGEAQLANAEAQLEISRGDYLRVVGRPAVDLQPLPQLAELPATIDEAFMIAEAHNANLASAVHLEEASRARIAAERGNQRPRASITGQLNKVGPLSPFDRNDFRTDAIAAITITQPLFQGGAIRSRIRQAQAENKIDQAALDGERRQALQDVVIAWNQLSAARISVVSGLRQVNAAQIAFAGMQREERYGLRSTIEVLNAEQELAAAQLTLLSNRATEYTARASLLLAMGTLDARMVNSAIPAKDPEAEFKKVRYRGMTPTEIPAMLIDRVGSASPYTKPKPDLRGANHPKPTGSAPLPPEPDKRYIQDPLLPIADTKLIPADQIPNVVGDYGEPAPDGTQPQ